MKQAIVSIALCAAMILFVNDKYPAAFNSLLNKVKSQFSTKKMGDEWIQLSKEIGYEGAAVIITNSKQQILFIVTEKGAELPGGKPERVDQGNPKATALRELQEETGITLTEDDLITQLTTTGGTSGCPAYQFITRPVDDVAPTLHVQWTWAKLVHEKSEWYVVTDEGSTPVRKFNRFVFDQNKDKLSEFMAQDYMIWRPAF